MVVSYRFTTMGFIVEYLWEIFISCNNDGSSYGKTKNKSLLCTVIISSWILCFVIKKRFKTTIDKLFSVSNMEFMNKW